MTSVCITTAFLAPAKRQSPSIRRILRACVRVCMYRTYTYSITFSTSVTSISRRSGDCPSFFPFMHLANEPNSPYDFDNCQAKEWHFQRIPFCELTYSNQPMLFASRCLPASVPRNLIRNYLVTPESFVLFLLPQKVCALPPPLHRYDKCTH